jgi:hypothetical protein
MNLRDSVQEVAELGLRRTLFRASWELRMRSGWFERFGSKPLAAAAARGVSLAPLPLEKPGAVRQAISPLLSADELSKMESTALLAARGQIVAFHWKEADFGFPIDWHRNPFGPGRWRDDVHWTRALNDSPDDVKFVWEIGRFHHAALLARTAVFLPERKAELGAALATQIDSFVASNPYPRGVHWFSGLELALRAINLLFARHVLGPTLDSEQLVLLLLQTGEHLDEYLAFSKHSAYNDHLIGEAAGLAAIARALPGYRHSSRWAKTGREILTAECSRQFFRDGGYFAQSHNYHRAVLQLLAFSKAIADEPSPAEWTQTLSRSAAFLFQQQNGLDGRLPNFGSNDGGIPLHITSTDYADFRPIIQTAAVAAGTRLLPEGMWDEESVWLFGAESMGLPRSPAPRRSSTFSSSGLHVLRSGDSDFGVVRCGSVTERFTQMDMLHLDVWINGENILADPGTYRYNGDPVSLAHFVRTGAHNTVMIDGQEQMLHRRQFKMSYWTPARTLRFEDRPHYAWFSGEHLGYVRTTGCTHRRCILLLKPDCWMIVDTLRGQGRHTARLHWLADADATPGEDGLNLRGTRATTLLSIFDLNGRPLPAAAERGSLSPMRGWVSRRYAERIPASSITVEASGSMPLGFVTLLGARTHGVNDAGQWPIRSSEHGVTVTVGPGGIEEVRNL